MNSLISTLLVSERVGLHCPVCGQEVANANPEQADTPCEHLLVAALGNVGFTYVSPSCKELADKATAAHDDHGINAFGYVVEYFGSRDVLYFAVEYNDIQHYYAFAFKPVAA